MSKEWNKRNPDKMRAAHKRWLAKHHRLGIFQRESCNTNKSNSLPK